MVHLEWGMVAEMALFALFIQFYLAQRKWTVQFIGDDYPCRRSNQRVGQCKPRQSNQSTTHFQF